MDIKDLKERKKALKLTTAQLAYLADLPVGTVSKIMTGETKNPSYATIEKIDRILLHEEMLQRLEHYKNSLLNYIREHPEETVDQLVFERNYKKEHELNDTPIPFSIKGANSSVNFGNLAIRRTDRITLTIYKEIGEDRQLELIDGHIIVNEAPGVSHQLMVQGLAGIIEEYIKKNNGKCRVFSAGVNVMPDEEMNTSVIPDLVVLCNDDILKEDGIIGAPDWIIEVASKSTRQRDYNTKMHKYMCAGVREYWVVDPLKEKVSVFIQGEPMMVYVYVFSDEIPVSVYNNELKICVGKIRLL